MSFYGTSINDTATVTAKAAADISDASFLAAKFNSSGEIAKADTAGENVLGLLMAEANDIKSGDDAYVQIKEVGLWKTGAAVAAGAELTTDANGKAVTATGGTFITAIALEAATVADTVIKVQIVKAGYKTAGGIGDLSDVDLSTAPTNGQVLKYNATTSKWAPGADAVE